MRLVNYIIIGFIAFLGAFVLVTGEGDYFEMRNKMVDEQIVERGIKNKKVIEAMRKVERHLFVKEAQKNLAYNDYPLPIGHDQTISQPFIVAYMTEIIEPLENDRILEIGTGSGYQAAVLAEIVKEVYTIEIVKALANESKARLKSFGYSNVFVKHGDGYEGWEEHAPFDKIIVTAAPEKIPLKLVDQLKVGGVMIVPVGVRNQSLRLIIKTKDSYDVQDLLPVRFVPMVKE